MVVYTNRTRTDPSPQRAAEPSAEFYDRIAGPYWDQVREMINEWWSHFPGHAHHGLRSRLLDRNSDANVSSALWELYLHEMLLGSGCTVEIERTVGSRSKNPDFLVTRGDDQFVVEAIWTSQRLGQAMGDVLPPVLSDAIDSVPSPNFFLAVSINTSGSPAPSQKRLKADLTRWLADLDPDQVIADRERNLPWPQHTWREAGWSITFEAMPRSPGRRGLASSRTIGIHPVMGGFLDNSELVFDAVKKKGKKYGQMPLPFIIAVGHAAMFPDDEDIDASLYGTLHEHGPVGGETTLTRQPDGYWTGPRNHSQVSGVLVVANPAPWTWARNTPVLRHSPDPDSIAAPVLPVWETMRLVGDQVERQSPTTPIHNAIGVTADWPIGEAFPRQASRA